ncbi:precorrin-8X methylmutase [Thalassobaculum sp.]|uniref:precorrin-8X methylmutase n=1 Tax=Thalassobaculum sp. TaxID=2022740 RepID=UPI0032EFA254
MTVRDWITDPAEITRRSFEIVQAEAGLGRFDAAERGVATRLIHACGMVEIAPDLRFAAGAVTAGQTALAAGAPVLVDARMVEAGVTRARLPADNQVVCTLNDPRVPGMAIEAGLTRSAVAVDLWVPHLDGAVVAIGNAPTALFRLLELLADGAPRPAVILGFPVGFVGAAESKAALAATDLPYLTLLGRRGGSAMASAAVNALAREGV